MKETYTAALQHGDKDVWMGCGRSGLCRPCGRIHDFSRRVGDKTVHDFRCRYNHEYGCPHPQPEPVHDLNRLGRCRRCGERMVERSKR